jgi:hypothetical protein
MKLRRAAARSLPLSSRLGRRQREVAAGSNTDQGRGYCHSPSGLVSEESSESCLLLLLMGKKVAECFKEKSFMAARVFFGRTCKIWPTPLVRVAGLGTQGQCRCLKALHDSEDANVYGAFG